jgi:hypothetical protein
MTPNKLDTLERGNVYFFFQPEVKQDVEDAPKMSMVMSPEESNCYRLLLVGLGHNNWGFVARPRVKPVLPESRSGQRMFTRGAQTK